MATTERNAVETGAEAPETGAAAGMPGKADGGRTKLRTRTVTVTVNGREQAREVEPRMLLVHFLREELGLTGTHIGCDTTNCGACTILLNGTPIKSCTMFAVQADGAEILTVEGLETGDGLHPLQEGFKEEHGLQCGFCTPGMLMVGLALLEKNLDPSDTQIRHAISGNLCRCTGYQNIVRSVRYAADRLAERASAEGTSVERASAAGTSAEGTDGRGATETMQEGAPS